MAGPRALHEGDDVLAGAESVAELEHFDGSSTRLDAGATAALDRIADPDGRPHLVLRLGPGNSFHRTAPDRSRRGQYEARTPTAAALARNATFVARCGEDGAGDFTVLTGTVVVRGTTGGTVVLRAGEAVAVAADGAVGDVAIVADDVLAADDWIAVNAWLDAEAAPPPEPEPQPEPAPEADSRPEPVATAPDERPLFIPEPDDHPWKVGVAAAVAISIGIFSVIIGRAGSARPVDSSADPDIAVPGPPAFSSPAYTAPAPAATAPPTTAVAAPPTTAPAARAVVPADAAAYEVISKSCSRGGTNVITFTGALRNKSSAPHTYSVRVRYTGPRDATVTTVTTTVEVPAGTTKTFRASTPPLRNAASFTACDADRVEVVG